MTAKRNAIWANGRRKGDCSGCQLTEVGRRHGSIDSPIRPTELPNRVAFNPTVLGL